MIMELTKDLDTETKKYLKYCENRFNQSKNEELSFRDSNYKTCHQIL